MFKVYILIDYLILCNYGQVKYLLEKGKEDLF